MKTNLSVRWLALLIGAQPICAIAQDAPVAASSEKTALEQRAAPESIAETPADADAPASPARSSAQESVAGDGTINGAKSGSDEKSTTLSVISLPERGIEAPSAGTPASSNRLIEEVLVTAQKREQRLQDVPLSIQAFSQEKLDVLGIESVQDVQRATPGFTVTNSAGFNITFLRGVGSDAFLPGVDSSVPFYLDGVPLLGIQGTSDTLGRVERVEVLKGPQGTLFGRNSTGGAISIITPAPDQVFSGDVKVEFGNYNTRNVVAYANVPVTESIAFNVSGYSNDRDNFIENDATGDVIDAFSRGARVKARWNALDTLSFTVSGSYQENSSNGSLDFQLVRPAPILAAALGPGDPKFDRHLAVDGAFGTKGKAYIVSGIVDWSTSYFDTKLTYSTQKVRTPVVDADFDGTPRPIANAHGGGFGGSKQFVEQDTAELQFLSTADTPFAEHFEWVAGLFYLSSRGGFDPIVFGVAPDAINVLLPDELGPTLTDTLNSVLGIVNLPPIGSQGAQLANYGLIDSKSYAGYAQGTFHATETIDLTAGLRYQDEKRNLIGSRTSFLLADDTEVTLPFPQGDTPELHPQQTSARLAAQWRPFGPNDQIYASLARGYKNPTYNTVNLLGNTFGTMVPLKAEKVDTGELGVKTTLFNGNLQINTAAFYTVQKNPLSSNVSIPSGGVANFTNAEEAEIKGVDGDFLAIPMPKANPGLVLTGGFSYLDATFTSFKNGQGYDDVTGLGFGGGGARLPARDLSGRRVPRVPEWSYQAAISQRVDLDAANALEIGADMFYSSKIFFLPQNSEFSTRDPVYIYNARVTYIYAPWSVEMTAFCNNIADKLYAESAFVSDFGTALIANSNPRLFGLRAKLSF